jgi:hypothetical protein
MSSTVNTYYCFVKVNSVSRPVWSNDVMMRFLHNESQIGHLQVKPSNGIISERNFRFEWKSAMTNWNVEFAYINKSGEQKFNMTIPVATILQDLKGGQFRVIPLNDELGVMEVKFSDNEYVPPSALSFCDTLHVGTDGLFFRPVQSTDYVKKGSIIDNNIKNPKKLIIAVDLTSSNGDVKDSSSLHNLDPSRNDYRKAIIKFSDLVAYLCPNTSMPVYGFGYSNNTRFTRSSVVSSSGQNKRKSAPEQYCSDFTNVYWEQNAPVGCGASIQCYDNMLEQLKTGELRLAGGTEFDRVLTEVESVAKSNEHTICLFFTDGQAEDKDKFLSRCRNLNGQRNKFVSIVLVVVGSGKDYIAREFMNQQNILVCQQTDLDSGKLYGLAMDWIENRSANLSKMCV